MHCSKKLALMVAGTLALGLLALAGCTVQGGTNSPDPTTKEEADQPQSEDSGKADGNQSGDVVSTAMVAYTNGDEVLFVDQATQTPYIPTEIDDAVITYDGQAIDEDDLVAGNVVKVTGNGIMLESYPGQYPGITNVEVIEQGSPADAEQYADIVDAVFAAPDQSQVPSGNLSYKTDTADVSVVLDPYEFEWRWQTEDGQTSSTQADGFAADGNGNLNDNLSDARINSAVDAVAAFSVNPTSVEIERTPLAKGSSSKIEAAAEDVEVACTLGEDGAVALRIEPNYLYELNVTFPQGEAEYAFYATN